MRKMDIGSKKPIRGSDTLGHRVYTRPYSNMLIRTFARGTVDVKVHYGGLILLVVVV